MIFVGIVCLHARHYRTGNSLSRSSISLFAGCSDFCFINGCQGIKSCTKHLSRFTSFFSKLLKNATWKQCRSPSCRPSQTPGWCPPQLGAGSGKGQSKSFHLTQCKRREADRSRWCVLYNADKYCLIMRIIRPIICA